MSMHNFLSPSLRQKLATMGASQRLQAVIDSFHAQAGTTDRAVIIDERDPQKRIQELLEASNRYLERGRAKQALANYYKHHLRTWKAAAMRSIESDAKHRNELWRANVQINELHARIAELSDALRTVGAQARKAADEEIAANCREPGEFGEGANLRREPEREDGLTEAGASLKFPIWPIR